MLGETLTPQQVGSVECGRVYRLCGNRVMCPLGVGDGVPLPPLFIHALIPVASVLLPPRWIHALQPVPSAPPSPPLQMGGAAVTLAAVWLINNRAPASSA